MTKNAVVFGGTRGIGLAVAKKFVREGYNVAVLSRSSESVRAGVEQLVRSRVSSDQRIYGNVCDVSGEDNVLQAFQAIKERSKSLDVLVNSAGVNVDNLLVKTRPEEVAHQLNANLVGAINTCKHALKVMLRQGSGCIINIGTLAVG